MRRRRDMELSVNLFSFQDIITSVMGIMILVALFAVLAFRVLSVSQPLAHAQPLMVTEDFDMRELEERAERLTAEVKSLKPKLNLERGRLEHEKRLEIRRFELENQLAVLRRKNEAVRRDVQNVRDPEALGKRLVEVAEEVEEATARLAQAKRRPRIRFLPGKGDSKLPILVQVRWRRIHIKPFNGALRQIPYSRPFDLYTAISSLRGVSRQNSYIVLLLRPSNSDNAWDLIRAVEKTGYEYGYEPIREIDQILGLDTMTGSQ